jgi:glycosyltransferase involved in cell wall biosynthesis
LGFAKYFLDKWNGEFVATLLTPFGVRAIRRSAARKLVESALSVWGEARTPDDDAVYKMIVARLSGRPLRGLPPHYRSATNARRAARGIWKAFLSSGGLFGSQATSRIPPGAVYLNTGQLGLSSARMLSWLTRRPDLTKIFMLHDTIPIDFPQFVTPLARRLHGNMITNAARISDGLIVTTKDVQQSVMREFARRDRKTVPLIASHLPVDAAFVGDSKSDNDLRRFEYFVVLGSIEPRKNHLFLLEVWTRLMSKLGPSAPKLIIVGTPWRESAAVMASIEKSEQLRGAVIVSPGLSTPGLRKVLRGARGLLMPSLAEGFGLPIIEALASKIPVIASDLPAHREVGAHHVIYIDPQDAAKWVRVICLVGDDTATATDRVLGYQPRTWDDYANDVMPFIENLWHERSSRRTNE